MQKEVIKVTLFNSLLLQALKDNKVEVKMDGFTTERLLSIVENKTYLALEAIREIVMDDSLSDFDCVEKIVSIFEELGSDGGVRHDFG